MQKVFKQRSMTGSELAAIRKAAGLSQTALGKLAGVGRHAVSYWECKAEVNLGAWAVKQIAGVLKLPDKFSHQRARASWGDTLHVKMQKLNDEAIRQARSKHRVRCGAKTRQGGPCLMKSIPGKRRCKFHGGLSTGAKTPEGKERIAEAQRKRWRHWRQSRTSL